MSALERVGPRHPECCKGNIGTGRCHYKASPSSDYCPIHAGGNSTKAAQRKELRNYKLETIAGKRAAEMANSGHLKDLTDEISLTRAVLEGILRTCKSDNELILYSDKISSLLRTTQGMVESLQKLQEKNKELIDRQTLMAVADGILGVILEYVTDPDQQRQAGEKIYECVIAGMGEQV